KFIFVLSLYLIILGSFSQAQTVAFDQSSLNFNNLEGIVSGTSLQFGPDKRLYTVQLNGEIKIFTIEKPSPNTYQVQSVEVLQGVKTIPNNDDNGKPAYDNRSKRQSTGIVVAG